MLQVRLAIYEEAAVACATRTGGQAIVEVCYYFTKTAANILVPGVGSLLEAEEIGGIVSAPSAELSDVLLQSGGNAGETQNLVG